MKKKKRRTKGCEVSPDPKEAFTEMVLTGSNLKLLHGLLFKLSSNELLQQDIFGDAVSVSVSNHWFITKVKYTDIVALSNLLYEELHRQCGCIFIGESSLPSILVADERGCLISDTKFSAENFILLLRCSMIILQFLEFDLSNVMERCQVLVAVLKELCHPNSLLRFKHFSLHPEDESTPDAGTSIDFFAAVLEVFIDELLGHPELRKLFTMTDCVSNTNEKLFVSHSCHGNIHAILELVSCHFFISLHDELSFKRFICSLSWSNDVGGEIRALGLDAALTLLGQPIIYSAPHLFQTHFILLTSRCIGIHMNPDDRKSDVLKMNGYILAFEVSVKLYLDYVPAIKFTNNIIGKKNEPSSHNTGVSFAFYVRALTYSKLNHHIDKFVDFHHRHPNVLFSATTVDVLESTITYIEGIQHFMDENFRDKSCLILRYIVTVILSSESETCNADEESIQQEMYCVAAILKLMSSSLLHIMWFVRQDGNLGGMKTSKHYLLCNEYNFILGVISSFEKYSGNQLLEKHLIDVMGTNAGRHKGAISMLLHMASLLLYSRRKNIEFLWKGCIFMLMSLLNIFIFEDGNLDAFKQLQHDSDDTFLHRSQDLVHRRSSARIAYNLQTARNKIKYGKYKERCTGNEKVDDMEPQDGGAKASNILSIRVRRKQKWTVDAITCKEKSFLECFPGYHGNHSEWKDLVDFIDCKPRKDYSSWTKKRESFRKCTHKKVAPKSRRDKKCKFLKVNCSEFKEQ